MTISIFLLLSCIVEVDYSDRRNLRSSFNPLNSSGKQHGRSTVTLPSDFIRLSLHSSISCWIFVSYLYFMELRIPSSYIHYLCADIIVLGELLDLCAQILSHLSMIFCMHLLIEAVIFSLLWKDLKCLVRNSETKKISHVCLSDCPCSCCFEWNALEFSKYAIQYTHA